MPRVKMRKIPISYKEIANSIFDRDIPDTWREGQFVFNRASELYGADFVRSIGHDPFYNNDNIKPFIEALVKALNKNCIN